MQRIRNHMRDEHQPGVLFGFLGRKFNLMKCLFEQFRVNAVLLHILQSLEKHLLNVAEVFFFDSLNSKGKRGLSCGVIIAGSRTKLRSFSLGYN